MPLMETMLLDVGPVIAKTLLKRWLGVGLATDLSGTITDLLKGQLSDRLTQRRASRQLEAIGELVAESLLPFFEIEGAHLEEGSREAIALAVAETLNTVTSDMLAKRNLDPALLTLHLLQTRPARLYHFSNTEKELYERIISEASQYIIDIASQLPTFTEKTLAEVLKRGDVLLVIAEKVLQEVQRMRADQDPQKKAASFEADYRRAVVRQLDILELFGAEVASTSQRYSLSVAYVTLHIERKNVLTKKRDRYRKGFLPEPYSEDSGPGNSIVSVHEALKDAKHLLIRGEAGSGKTTILQWIAVKAAQRDFPEILKDFNSYVPFFIRLRECVDIKLPDPEKFPSFVASTIIGKMPHGWVHTILESGRAIVLIDGLDEVPMEQRKDVQRWLRELLGAFPAIRCIVTSRRQAAEKGWMEAEGFEDISLRPMELPNIRAFIDHWHQAVAKDIQEDDEKVRLTRLAAALKGTVQKDHAKRNLANSPLLCAMMCALHRQHHQQLPSDRLELYRVCCHLLVERRDQTRGVSLKDYPAADLDYQQKCMLLKDLAYYLIKNGWTQLKRDNIDKRFSRTLEKMQNIPKDMTGVAARRYFVERSGIIREPVVNVIEFAHRTFQEYLAAQASVDEDDLGVLVKHAYDDQWRELISMASGLFRKKMREDLIAQLLGRGEAEKAYRYQLFTLAALCSQAAAERLSKRTRLRMERRLKEISPPKTMQEAEVLATAGEFAVPHLHMRYDYSAEVAAACVRALTLINNTAALDILEEYTNDASGTVVQELFKGLNRVDENEKRRYAQRILARFTKIPYAWEGSLDGFQYLEHIVELRLVLCHPSIDG